MEKVKKIINSISWVIVALTGILLIVKWNDIPALVITHIGMGISYGSKNILPMLFCIELVVTFLFTLRYDIPFIREMRKSKVSRKFLDIMAIIIQMDIFFLFLDILLLVLFGTALSSIINFFLSTQGQISAVGTIISAGYGFICGAYMPISSFGKGLQKIISFLPGTYGTSLIRNHTMQGALAEIQNQGIPIVIIEKLKDSLDCNLYFFGSQVNIGTMYMILGITILVLIGIYILLNKSKKYNC